MTVFEYKAKEVEGGDPPIVDRIEVRPWRLGGKSHQDFSIGSGANFSATGNILIEIIYAINDVQLFYTRNYLHSMEYEFSLTDNLEWLEKFAAGESDSYSFGGMLPETSIVLRRERSTDNTTDGEPETHIWHTLKLSADIGAGIARSEPGVRKIEIKLDFISLEEGVDFMRRLTNEIAALYEEKHPNPADFPAASSHWNFSRLVNQKAYDQISLDYEENYFDEPLLTETFDAWLAAIPAGGHILDVGCGHGKPVITRLLEKGYRVTGADLSPKMLERARQNFPEVSFINQLASELTHEAEFDGACSLSSLLYLDPIDLSHSLYRLYHALKPDGLLFLHTYEQHPGWRGHPYHIDIKQWMWGWTYGLEEAVQFLEEHGFFKVLKAQDVTSAEERQTRIEKWYQWAKEAHEASLQKYPDYPSPEPDKNNLPALPYKYIIMAQRQTR